MGSNKEIEQFTPEESQEIAAQLSCPQGVNGIKIANSMTETNMGMICKTIDLLQLNEGEKVLELGPGEGKHLPYLFDSIPGILYTALEISPLMAHKCQENHPEYFESQQANIHLYEGENIPFSEPIFDAIFTVNTLYFWTKPQEFLHQLSKALKTPGSCIITIADKGFLEELPFTRYGFNIYSLEDLKQLVDKSPFNWTECLTHKEKINIGANQLKERTYHTVILKNK
jgi:SAM-dependent methyltransferase